MVVPHYAYLKMKMPSSKGILTVAGDYRKSSACAAESNRLAECHAQYETLSKRNSKVPPRIDPHIETLLQGGYHYINIT